MEKSVIVWGSVYLYSIKYTKNIKFQKVCRSYLLMFLFYDLKYFAAQQVYRKKLGLKVGLTESSKDNNT